MFLLNLLPLYTRVLVCNFPGLKAAVIYHKILAGQKNVVIFSLKGGSRLLDQLTPELLYPKSLSRETRIGLKTHDIARSFHKTITTALIRKIFKKKRKEKKEKDGK